MVFSFRTPKGVTRRHLKLDELIRALQGARKAFVDIEPSSQDKIDELGA